MSEMSNTIKDTEGNVYIRDDLYDIAESRFGFRPDVAAVVVNKLEAENKRLREAIDRAGALACQRASHELIADALDEAKSND